MVLLQSFFPPDLLIRLRDAAIRCFAAIESPGPVPESYRFNRQAHSVPVSTLLEFGINAADLTAPLSADALSPMFSDLVGAQWRCRLEHSWVRKKFAPQNAPASGYHLQDWHQDGALGVKFPPEPGPPIPPSNLVTCWIPLNGCGVDSPGLEFIRQSQPALLHFTELDDAILRHRFDAEAFWTPALQFGDGLVFRNHVLHRTHVTGEMRNNRISVEYRIFPDNS